MKQLLDLVAENNIQELATPADFRLGKEIARKGGVELVEISPVRVLARVQPRGGQKRTVQMSATEDDLKCKCT